MKTALLIWEMGGGLGHLTQLKSRAAQLENEGFRIKYLLKDISYLNKRDFFDCAPSDILDVPLISPIHPAEGNARNFSDLLYRNGYADSTKISNAANEYRRIIDRVAPDHIVLDFSPLAQILAKSYNISKEIIGPPFTVPCVNNKPGAAFSFPLYFPSTDLKGLYKIERDLSICLNAAANRNESLKELFTDKLAKERIAAIPELDFFGKFRKQTSDYYWLPVAPITNDNAEGSFVFGYLKNLGHVNEIVEALSLKDPQTQFLFHINNFSLRKKFPNVTVINEILNSKEFSKAIQQSKYVINNGGCLVNVEAILCGKPILSFPLHLENLLNASMIVANKAGGIITYRETLNKVIDDFYAQLNEFVKNARLIQNKYNTEEEIL